MCEAATAFSNPSAQVPLPPLPVLMAVEQERMPSSRCEPLAAVLRQQRH